jgi:Esterase-like activity of phytase
MPRMAASGNSRNVWHCVLGRAVKGFVAMFVAIAAPRGRADWTITRRNAVSLSAPAAWEVRELSGVSYIGPAGVGLHRFAAIQDENGRVVMLDIGLSTGANITSATAQSVVSLDISQDYEGIAYTGPGRHSVFVSEETTSGVHEHSLSAGSRLQSLGLPDVLKLDRANRGLESLTRSLDGTVMWTANEEALSPDGAEATQSHGTTVRLQQLLAHGTVVSTGPQFAYTVDPIHAGSGPDRSGLSDLLLLPDNRLVALERSFTSRSPFFHNRIYEIDFTGATDISQPQFATGLDGKAFTPVGKTLLWSGQIAGAVSNLEGLALGPQLEPRKWALLGVIDNSGTGPNIVAAFELNQYCPVEGDYDCSGDVGVDDYALWSQSFGATGAPAADGNGNSIVDAADYVVWRKHNVSVAGAANFGVAHSLPEPGTTLLVAIALVSLLDRRRRSRVTQNGPFNKPLTP